jgi:uncharacterized protein (TIGR02147 family)
MGCQTAFLSQVLHGHPQLSLEAGEKLNPSLGHSKDEAAFFLLLVQYARAGTEGLREFFRAQMREIVARRESLKERLTSSREVSHEDYSTYFSSWTYSAIHTFLTVPPFQTKASILRELKIPPETATKVLEFLVDRGLANQKGDHYSVGSFHFHLGNDTAVVARHHTNWRLRAIDSFERELKGDLHYSSVVSLSAKDAERLKVFLQECLSESRKIIEPSKEECLFGFCIDYFRLTE